MEGNDGSPDEAIEFDPPQEASTSTIAQDFDDFLYSESSGQGSELIASGGINSLANSGAKENVLFDFYDDWEEDGDDDLFGNQPSAGGNKGG